MWSSYTVYTQEVKNKAPQSLSKTAVSNFKGKSDTLSFGKTRTPNKNKISDKR